MKNNQIESGFISAKQTQPDMRVTDRYAVTKNNVFRTGHVERIRVIDEGGGSQ